ncbi:MAG: transporter substrate-binding protein [Firmicutes bacterium]|nr:transporter substrate-binding protein [Bacillota bacterium]
MRKASRVLAAAVATGVLALAGCSGAQQTPKTDGGQTTPAPVPAKTVELNFSFPIAVGGAVQKNVEAMVNDFNTANPTIKVTPSFAGNYQETMTKVQAAKPEIAVLQATDVFTLTDTDIIVPIDEYIAADKDGQAYMSDLLPAFMANSKLNGKTWSVPFQRSTVVLYYNKDLFKAAGLDPEKPPTNWQQLVEYGKKLTKPDGSQWGVEIPSDGNPSWTFSSFFYEAGAKPVNDLGTEVAFNSPEITSAMDFIVGLSKTDKVMPTGVLKWNDLPNDFVAGKAAMIYHTTGTIGAVKAKMDPAKIGVAALPAGKQAGSPTGGGNLYILKSTKEKQDAAWKFVRFMTDTERVAKWSVDTGYIPYRKSATETSTWKEAVKAFPGYGTAAGAMKDAAGEIASHSNQQVLKALGDQLQAIIGGTKETKPALDQAQKDAEAILKQFKK